MIMQTRSGGLLKQATLLGLTLGETGFAGYWPGRLMCPVLSYLATVMMLRDGPTGLTSSFPT